MTAVLFLLVGITVTAMPAVIGWHLCDERHHWRRVRLEAGRFHDLCDWCDSLERHNRRLTDEQAELREGVGDLLDTVAHYEHVIGRLTEPAPAYADFAYGAHQ